MTWVVVILFLFFTPVVLTVLAKLEERFTGFQMDWDNLKYSTWYIFGSFLGETMTSATRDIKTWAVRLVITSWFFYAFLLTTAYGGVLRAFLLKPEFSETISDLTQVVAKGLPWKVVLYGDWTEDRISKSEIDYVKKYWDEKEPQRYQDFPLDMVCTKSLIVEFCTLSNQDSLINK